MPKVEPFESNAARYDGWFDRNKIVYESEIRAVRSLLPEGGTAIEIGAGTGRFAAPLGIPFGIEPSRAMGRAARERGVEVIEGAAEALPCRDDVFDNALIVTTICFVDDLEKTFQEAFRVLQPGGYLVVGFVDRGSALGKAYEKRRRRSVFYGAAVFYSADDVVFRMGNAGFENIILVQTVFHGPGETAEIEPVRAGHGEGSFVVARGEKPHA
jgi:SAM-dependent methyltransferase